MSRLSREKRPELALAALRMLRSRGVPAGLLVLVDGPLRDRMHRAAAELPVRFLDHVADRRCVASAERARGPTYRRLRAGLQPGSARQTAGSSSPSAHSATPASLCRVTAVARTRTASASAYQTVRPPYRK